MGEFVVGVCHTLGRVGVCGHTLPGRGQPLCPSAPRRAAQQAVAANQSLKQRITKLGLAPGWQALQALQTRLAQPGNPLGGLKPGRERWSLRSAFHAQEPCYRTCLKSRQDPTF